MPDRARVLEMLRDAIVMVDDGVSIEDVTEDACLQEGGLKLDSLAILEVIDEMQKGLDVDMATDRFDFKETGKSGPTVGMVADRIMEVLREGGMAA